MDWTKIEIFPLNNRTYNFSWRLHENWMNAENQLILNKLGLNALFGNHMEKVMCPLQSVCNLVFFLPFVHGKRWGRKLKRRWNWQQQHQQRERKTALRFSHIYMFQVGCHQYDGRCTCLGVHCACREYKQNKQIYKWQHKYARTHIDWKHWKCRHRQIHIMCSAHVFTHACWHWHWHWHEVCGRFLCSVHPQ